VNGTGTGAGTGEGMGAIGGDGKVSVRLLRDGLGGDEGVDCLRWVDVSGVNLGYATSTTYTDYW